MIDEKRDCTHGQLARSCHVCELEKENQELKQALSGRTVSCSNCNDLAQRLEAAKFIAGTCWEDLTKDQESLINEQAKKIERLEKVREAAEVYAVIRESNTNAQKAENLLLEIQNFVKLQQALAALGKP